MTPTRNAAPLVRRSVERADTLRPAAYNPRKISKEALKGLQASIERWGVVQDIVVNSRNLVVIGGHQRLAALKVAGVKDVPVTWVDLDEADERALNVALNNPHISGEFDDTLQDLLQSIKDGIGLPVMQDLKLDELLAPVPVEGQTDPDDVPEAPEEPVTKPGDVWLMGDHRLMCGDSTSIDAVERLCDGQLVDMWLTDPPYNVAYEGKTKDALKIQNDSMADGQFRQFLRDAYVAADAVMKPGAVFYIWHADLEGYNFRGAAKDAGWTVRQCLIWKKQSMVMGRQDYHWKHEPCLYGWKDDAAHFWASDRKQTTLLEFDKPSRNGEHPTMKPVALFEYQMLNNTKVGSVVLDSFGGSGTTLIAAERAGRKALLMELDPKYCDVIVKRWEDFTGRKAVLDVTNA
jgi:site-specific DNA-methyltransferase (adenine-specific)